MLWSDPLPIGPADIDITDTTSDLPHSWFEDVTIGQIIIGLIVIAVVVTAVWKMIKAFSKLWATIAPLENFFRDWNGEDARPGVPERPGVMARLGSQDGRLERIETHLNDAPTRAEFDTLKQQVDANTTTLQMLNPTVVIQQQPPDHD